MRPTVHPLGLLPLLLAPAALQSIAVRTFHGTQPGEALGLCVRGAGDVDDDGFDDVVAGAPYNNTNGFASGRACVLSGRDGTVLHPFLGAGGDQLGRSVDGAGDVDGDGLADVVVGIPGSGAGSAVIRSGLDGAVLHTLLGGAAGDAFGTSVAGVGDVDGDGVGDVAVGAPFADAAGPSSGLVQVVSGATGLVLRTLPGSAAGDMFGTSVAGAGDVDDDGRDDWIAGAPRADSDAGYARVVSGLDGSTLHLFEGGHFPWGHKLLGEGLGVSVDGAGDVDGDGRPDLIVGANQYDTYRGRARVFSGLTGAELFAFVGPVADGELGWAVAGAGDVDGDGRADLIVGNQGFAGRVELRSGLDGSLLMHFTGTGIDLGYSVAGIGDADGDGFTDVAFGAHGSDAGGTNSGSVRLVSGLQTGALSEIYCSGDDATCPCGNGGLPGHGCDIAQGTGGIALALQAFAPDHAGGGTAELVATGYPPASTPGVTLIRSGAPQDPPSVFGDGLLCLAPAVVRINATLASGGTSTNPVMHGAGAGTFFYQVWVRNTPVMFCDPTAAYNLSNGVSITWP